MFCISQNMPIRYAYNFIKRTDLKYYTLSKDFAMDIFNLGIHKKTHFMIHYSEMMKNMSILTISFYIRKIPLLKGEYTRCISNI
jgi:hypothetical protein